MGRFEAIRRLIGEFRGHKLAVFWIVVLGSLVSIIQPLCVKITEKVIDTLQAGVDPSFFKTIPLALVGVFLISGLSKYFYNTIRRTLSETVVCKLRDQLFHRFLYSPLSTQQKKRAGDFLSSIQNDLVQVSNGLETLYDLLKEPVAFIGLMGVAFYCDWRLALATLVVAPVVVLFFSWSGSAVKRYTAKTLINFSDIISLGQESIVGAQIVKIFRLEETLIRKFRSYQDHYYNMLRRSIQVQETATPAVEFVGALLMAGVLYYGAHRIAIGELTSGKLIAFIIAIGLAQMPIKKLNNSYLRLKIAEAAGERIFAYIDSPMPYRPDVRRVDSFQSTIEYRNVGLRYIEEWALRDISFKVNRGECVAFVGPSGSGKTSLVNLLPRLFEVSSGSILLDGTDIRELDVHDLRGLISVVNQETFLFNDTIWENIRYGRPEATEKEIREAAEMANCLPFVSRFTEGFQTRVGDRGSQLSGGERQRVAIARSLLKGAPILVLDEATSSLDSESEAMVQGALERLMKDRTVFMIAHRFSTIKKADRIYVIEDGQIGEDGTHSDLVSNQGTYSRLLERQVFV
ncbi:MAG: ABC transporter ATP-binding protein [Bdellovibrionaceae bacterium]|nr:ABC transporter ATP-binding protein [Bdellovibrionales bacterium]MCB9253676.1 ABC transporter ATP-binding protein [Pseudobdellovibrionaceae bacterium]